jgi:hypothetical protein
MFRRSSKVYERYKFLDITSDNCRWTADGTSQGMLSSWKQYHFVETQKAPLQIYVQNHDQYEQLKV